MAQFPACASSPSLRRHQCASRPLPISSPSFVCLVAPFSLSPCARSPIPIPSLSFVPILSTLHRRPWPFSPTVRRRRPLQSSAVTSSLGMPLLTHFTSCIPPPPVRRTCHRPVCYSTTPQWESAPLTYAPENEGSLLTEAATNIFETISKPDEAAITKAEQAFDYLRHTLWVLGPALLLITGVVPTLWLPVSSIFLGPNIATLLSLTGLDCIFNLGASLFLLMADSVARLNHICRTKPPPGYRFWNILANATGFIIPLMMLIASCKGFIEPHMPLISFAVVLVPYFLLLSVQMLTELLTWHWESPVWLVTPLVYEAYRLLQLMRGLKLAAELGAASWMMNTVRGLVCCWVLVLGVQLMRVAWYAGFTAPTYPHHPALA